MSYESRRLATKIVEAEKSVLRQHRQYVSDRDLRLLTNYCTELGRLTGLYEAMELVAGREKHQFTDPWLDERIAAVGVKI